ncbi:MAG: class I SAM-dependent methyltransferase [Mycobacteriales bacterium]
MTQARRIAAEAGAEVSYVQSNVYDALDVLGDRRFDVIYTGKGALCHLPDVNRWAALVAQLLRPGGLLYLVEFHPMLNALGLEQPEEPAQELRLCHDYLEGRGADENDATYTYTDGPALRSGTVSYQWSHSLAEVTNALIGAGLRITRLRESELLPWRCWGRMIPAGKGWWRFPDSGPRVPLLYAIRAYKEG